jgi:hypothetical protein
MTRLSTAISHHRSVRAQLRQERALERALSMAPTIESAHELAALSARR